MQICLMDRAFNVSILIYEDEYVYIRNTAIILLLLSNIKTNIYNYNYSVDAREQLNVYSNNNYSLIILKSLP